MARDYARIANSLWHSRKWRLIRENEPRLLYFYLHTCPQANSIGVFRLPKGYAMADLHWSERAFDRAIEALREADLVSHDPGEEVVRIVGYLKHSPITNTKHAAGSAKLALALPKCPERAAIVLELLADRYVQALDWMVDKLCGLDSPIHRPTHTPLAPSPQPLEEEIDKSESAERGESPRDLRSPPPPDADELPWLDEKPEATPKQGLAVRERTAPCAEVVAAWNAMAERTGLPQVQHLTAKRKKAIPLRLAELGGIEGWHAAVAKVEASRFCRGHNERGWVCDFDFLLNPSSLTKVMEGKYDDRSGTPPGYRPAGGAASGDELNRRVAGAAARRMERERAAAGADDGHGLP